MPYIAYANLAHLILGLILSSFSVYYSVNVLFRKSILKASVKLSPTITVYFGFVLICSVSACATYVFFITCWRPEGSDYNAYILYLTGWIPGLFFNTSSIAETFLCIERCISLLFPLKYSPPYNIYFAVLTIFCILAAMGFTVIALKYFEIYPTTSKTACQTFSCFIGSSSTQIMFVQKVVLSIVNISFALLLAYLIKKTIINSNSAAQMNKTVFILLLSTTFIEIIPILCAFLFNVITGEQLQQYTGPFSLTVIVLNITLSSALYYNAFKRASKNPNKNGTKNGSPALASFTTQNQINNKTIIFLKE